ncbi:MAG: hypothetical protein COV34_02835 [Candidatus Zambryskibacteria bacterium CG10_big_fil_rev_8_21_14_0_10_42_12]|uniref:DUF2177 domain-containing protein n=1 Tax=Candidatus Zambryskibacteria bacterium CG10_big_fil_rev_8_21_14_0_10_42_12 TaxID=1975115 RepID=A0A2H0QUN7_9BACT|nr:MAG: hypothetical protein COV34_02835 [Candidatus Zambryskibacteria bacterium CG10_big_fil_rev_8_21_14_0_10_42_12]
MGFEEFLSFHVLSIVALVWVVDKVWRVETASFYRRYGATHGVPDKMTFGGEPGISDLFWGVMYGLILLYVEVPFKEGLLDKQEVFLRGFLIGMAIYMLFNLTNKDVVFKWSMFLILIDIVWGGLLGGIFTTILLS